MFCINCGAKNKDEARFCITCGKPLKRSENVSGKTIKMSYVREELEDEIELDEVRKVKKGSTSTGTITLIIVAIVAAIGVGCFTGYKVISENTKTAVNDKVPTKPSTSEDKRFSKSEEKDSKEDKVNESLSEYLIPESDSKVLSYDDVSHLSKEDLALARNEIYARHGYVFKNEVYREYFNSKPWYVENPGFSGNESELNSYEKANVKLIKSLENN